jgi:hypothetical protein|tara:strand:- start:620 stop:835 length:216 start_codon:yes stop_codon:yes gene_type:complete
MEELMDLLVKDESPTQISDAIKDMLYARTAEKVNNATPGIMNTVFDGDQPEATVEVEQGVDSEETSEEEQI